MKALAWAKRAASPFLAMADNPILLKELRAGMRGARYFATFMTVLSIVGGVLLTVFALSGAARDEDPAAIGANVFRFAFALNIIVAFLVVPSFGATSITSERERQTYDILMSTTLSARQIVWGKVLASLAQVGAIFLSTIPIVGLTFLFGGVTVQQMVAGYVTLFALCIMLSVWAISISASAQSSQRAVASAYGGAILVFFVCWGLSEALLRSRLGYAFAEAYGLQMNFHRWGGIPAVGAWERILYVYLLPIYFFVSFVSLLLLNAASRLKSTFDEKSPPFRVFYFVAAAAGLALAYAIFMTDIASESADERMSFLMVIAFLSFIVGSLSCIFAAESPLPPLHVRERYAALTGWRRWRWIIAPGSRQGAYFCIGVNVLLAGVAVLLFGGHTRGFDQGSWLEFPTIVPLLRSVLSVLVWIVFLSGVAAWLGSMLAGRPRTIGIIMVLLILGLSAIPMIHWSVDARNAERMMLMNEHRSEYPGPFTLALSPVAGIWSSLSVVHDGYRTIPLHVRLFGLELGLHATQAVLFLVAGFTLHVFARRRQAALLARAP